MQQDLTQEILERIDALAATLGTTAEYLWPTLARYEFARAAGIMLALAALCAVASLFARTLWRRYRDFTPKRVKRAKFKYEFIREEPYEYEADDMEPRHALLVFSCIATAVAAVALFMAAGFAPSCVATMAAPEAAALNRLIN